MRAHEVYLANIYISSLDQHLCFVISCTGKMRPCLGRGQICLRSSHPKEAIEASSTQPHLVFNFNIKVDGTVVNFDVTKLKLSGCELKLLGERL